MSNAADLTTVIRLACLTEDRSDAEQKALLRIADRVDFEHNKNTVGGASTKDGWEPSFLYDEVQSSRCLVDNQKHVELPKRRGVWPRKP